jgi:hypothetical protein
MKKDTGIMAARKPIRPSTNHALKYRTSHGNSNFRNIFTRMICEVAQRVAFVQQATVPRVASARSGILEAHRVAKNEERKPGPCGNPPQIILRVFV